MPAEGPVSPELAALFAGTSHLSDSPMAVKDREIIVFLETAMPAGDRERMVASVGEALGSPGAMVRAGEAYALLDALADDPRVEEAAVALAGCIPPGLFPEAGELGSEAGGLDPDDGFLRAFYDDLAPAQAAAVRRTLRILAEERR
jgi:hypothetical protein